ncbi:DedA family protein [Litorihabitans aurantiacus]|uniref:VTT domain-containing protein n=1 Tax=Litorihabitans aurantiacus TaxID=1930061 RepID=A0AA38CTZ9_9MICO|nr:DedA family protein [Litorihabitans aurantiacus]GMA32262.1 hypothetical protein GCM10025875_22540 [Litorihabitans aurantiacus]
MLLVLYVFCTIDGFFPPVPSESIVIALATLSIHGDALPLWAVIPVAAAGAMTGDLIAFAIGRRIPIHRLRIFRTRRGRALLAWAEKQLRVRGGVFILAARYVPVGRVAVNITAGAVGFPLRRFLAFDAVAAILWACFGSAIGIVAGALFHGNPLLSIAVGVAGGVLIGLLMDKLLARLGFGPAELSPRDRAALARDGALPAGAEATGGEAQTGASESVEGAVDAEDRPRG